MDAAVLVWEPGREAGPLDGLSAQFQAEPSAYRQLLTGNQLAGTALPPEPEGKPPSWFAPHCVWDAGGHIRPLASA